MLKHPRQINSCFLFCIIVCILFSIVLLKLKQKHLERPLNGCLCLKDILQLNVVHMDFIPQFNMKLAANLDDQLLINL